MFNCPKQLEGRAGKLACDKAAGDLKTALKWEREEHQQLLAESYGAVMDLTQQLQISEKNWSQEKLELLDRFNNERSLSEQRLKEMQHKINQVSTKELLRVLGTILLPKYF